MMTIMQLFESVKIKGYVLLYNKQEFIPVIYCDGKYPLDNIPIEYWDREILGMTIDNNKFCLKIKGESKNENEN